MALELVGRGWAAWEPNPRHRRAPLLACTDSGRCHAASLDAAAVARLNAWAADRDPAELRAAARLLRALAAARG